MEQIMISEALKSKLAEAETMEDIVRFCAEEGIEVTEKQLEAAANYQFEELHEDELDQVAGGYAGLVLALALLILAIKIKEERERRVREKLRNSRK